MSSNNSSFAELDNVISISSTNKPHDDKRSLSSFIASRHIFSTLIGSLYILSILVNLRVLYLINSRFFKRIKIRIFVSLLIAHLSVVCIVIATLTVLDICQYRNLLEGFGPLASQIVDFWLDSCVCVFSLNTVLIVNERFRRFTELYESVHIYRILGGLWVASCAQAIFAKALFYWKTKNSKNFIMISIGILYEILRFLIFHLVVVTAIAYGLLKVQLKLGRLERPCRRIKAKMEKLPCLFTLFGSYSILWILFGIWWAARGCAFIMGVDIDPYSGFELGLYAYLAFHPMVHLRLLNAKTAFICQRGNFAREEELFIAILDDENSITAEPSPPQAIKEQQRAKLQRPTTLIRQLSASPIKFGRLSNQSQQINIQSDQADKYADIEYIDAGSEEEAILDKGAAGNAKRVSFSITYYSEEEQSDHSEMKDSVLLENDKISDSKEKETHI